MVKDEFKNKIINKLKEIRSKNLDDKYTITLQGCVLNNFLKMSLVLLDTDDIKRTLKDDINNSLYQVLGDFVIKKEED